MTIDRIATIPPERVQLLVLESASKALTREGVSGPPGLGLQYASEGLCRLFEEVGKCQVQFRYNSLDLERIHVLHPTTGEWIPATCTYGAYAVGLSAFIHTCIKQRLKEREVAATPEALSAGRRSLNSLVEEAKSGLKQKRRARTQEQNRASRNQSPATAAADVTAPQGDELTYRDIDSDAAPAYDILPSQ